jgi:hypothetical protein
MIDARPPLRLYECVVCADFSVSVIYTRPFVVPQICLVCGVWHWEATTLPVACVPADDWRTCNCAVSSPGTPCYTVVTSSGAQGQPLRPHEWVDASVYSPCSNTHTTLVVLQIFFYLRGLSSWHNNLLLFASLLRTSPCSKCAVLFWHAAQHSRHLFWCTRSALATALMGYREDFFLIVAISTPSLPVLQICFYLRGQPSMFVLPEFQLGMCTPSTCTVLSCLAYFHYHECSVARTSFTSITVPLLVSYAAMPTHRCRI